MIVKNNIIKLPRGESAQFAYQGVQKSGEPYILPPKTHPSLSLSERIDYAILAFTVSTGTNGEIVLEKYYDLEAPPMYNGKTDYTPGGYHKFTQIAIEEFVASSALEDAAAGKFKVYKDSKTGGFVHVITNKDGEFEIVPYEFRLVLSIEHSDTVNLNPKEYLYDLTAYFGELTKAEIDAMDSGEQLPGFPLKRIAIKDVFIKTQNFVLEDSNNV